VLPDSARQRFGPSQSIARRPQLSQASHRAMPCCSGRMPGLSVGTCRKHVNAIQVWMIAWSVAMSALSEVVCRSAAVDSACRPGPETLSPCSSPGADARCSRAAFVAIPTHAASVAVSSSSIARCPVKVVHATPVRRPLLTLEGPVRSKTGLPVSMTFAGDDADEVKMDYSRADEDGSRIFLSGLAQSACSWRCSRSRA